MDQWQPKNYRGSWYTDPRDELRARAKQARQLGDTYAAVPVALALACADLHECDATTIATQDEDGPLPTPLQIFCRLPRDHQHMHYNGYTHWT